MQKKNSASVCIFSQLQNCNIEIFVYASEAVTYVRNIEKKNIHWWPKNISFTRTTSCILGDTRTIWWRYHEITRVRLNETRFGPIKIRPRYISAPKISTLFWFTEWEWDWQIIFRFASIHGVPVSIDGKTILTLYYSTLPKST